MNALKNINLIKALLAGKSCTFASIVYQTEIKTAAKYRHVKIEKIVTANVQLFSNIKTATDVFKNAVKNSALKLGEDTQHVEQFQKSENYFIHDLECYSLVKHKEKEAYYLWAIFNSSKSVFLIDGEPASRDEVAQHLTQSAARDLLNPSKIIYNVKNDLQHTIKVRAVKIENILKIKAGAEISF